MNDGRSNDGQARHSRRFEKVERIRFSHCDPAAIVFYPQYFVLFNGFIEDWVTDCLGISYADLVAIRRIGLPTVSIQTEFKAVSRMGDDVTFGLEVEALGTKSLTLRLDCRGEPDGALRVQARNVLVLTDLQTHRSIPVPPDLRAAIERFGVG